MGTKTYMVIITDHSKSMTDKRSAAVKDYNKLVADIREAAVQNGDDTIVSVVQCGIGNGWRADNRFSVINSSVSAVGELQLQDYVIEGNSTPLYDAVGMAIRSLEQVPDYKNEEIAFAVMVITDGEENSSSTWSEYLLRSEIKRLQSTERWSFIFRVPTGYKRKLVRDLNLYDGNVLEWKTTVKGYEKSTVVNTSAVHSFYAARSAGVRSTKGFYTTNLTDVTMDTVKAQLVDVSTQVHFWTVDPNEAGSQIRDFCEHHSGAKFLKGAAFYQLTKNEREVQDYKLIGIQEDTTGAVYIGPAARDMLGLPSHGTIALHPGDHAGYKVFIQSTSVNRKLPVNTLVMYWPQVGTQYKEGKSS